MTGKITLKTLLGDYKNTMPMKSGEVSSSLVDFEFADVKLPNTRAYLDLAFATPSNPAAVRPLLSDLRCPRTL